MNAYFYNDDRSKQIHSKRIPAWSLRNFLLCVLLTLLVIACRKEPTRSEHLSALIANEAAQKKMADLGKSLKPSMVVAESMITWRAEDGDVEYTVPSWVFVFPDESAPGGSVSIEVRGKSEGQGMLKMKSRVTDINFPAQLAKELAGITNWVLDIEAAQSIMKRAGAQPRAGTFLLKMREVDGVLAPVWTMPLNIPDALSSGVRADNGVIVYLKNTEKERWTKDNRSEL